MESNSKFLSEYSDKERESAYKKYNIIKPYLEGIALAKEVAFDNNIPNRTFFVG